MKIKKMYQGTVPESKILETYSDSPIDTYSCNYLNRNIITAFLQNTNYSSGVYSTIGNYVKVGDKLEVVGNTIKIGEGVSKVKISACFNIQPNSAGNNNIKLNIKKSGTSIIQTYEYTNIAQYYYMTCEVVDFLEQVQSGDTISIECNSDKAGVIHNDQYGKSYFTVEVIE